jgi:hypothetical protein
LRLGVAIGHKAERQPVDGGMVFACRFNPLRTEMWSESVAIIVSVYFGDHGRRGKRQCVGIEFGTANHPYIVSLLTKR